MVVSALLWTMRDSPRDVHDQLLVELFGMVTNRQRAAQAPAVPIARPPIAARPVKTTAPPSPEAVRDPLVQIAQEVAPAAPAPTTAAGAALPGAEVSNEAQRAETIVPRDTQADELKHYLAGVRKRLKSHLVISEEARRMGYEGVPVVGFTLDETGWMMPATLRIVQSSGYPGLDADALRAARDSEPFDPPPRRIEVVVAVSFEATVH